MNISIIAAMTNNNIIGANGNLPWKIKAELEYFKQQTLNKVIIMGSNTFASIKCKPLANRQNIVLTKNVAKFEQSKLTQNYNNLFFVDHITDSLTKAGQLIANNEALPEIMVIGGATIYTQFLPLANKLYLSIIKKDDYAGDIYFPKVDLTAWQLQSSEDYDEFIAKIYSCNGKF